MGKIYEAFLEGKLVDSDEDDTDLIRRCTNEYGFYVVMSPDFKIEEKQEVPTRS